MDPYDYLDSDYEEYLKKQNEKKCTIKITTRTTIYFWYRAIQLYLWDVFRPYEAYELQEFILEEFETKTEKYLKFKFKEMR